MGCVCVQSASRQNAIALVKRLTGVGSATPRGDGRESKAAGFPPVKCQSQDAIERVVAASQKCLCSGVVDHLDGSRREVRYRSPVSSFRRSGWQSRSLKRFTNAGMGADSPRSPRERVVAATRLFGGPGLAEAELPAYPTDFRPLPSTRLQHQLVACSGVPFRASPVEFNFPTRGTTPPRQALDFG